MKKQRKMMERWKFGGRMQVEEIIEKIAMLCRECGVTKAYLFGSRAKGTERERSDIDIAVMGINDFAILEEAVENLPTLYTIDLVNMDECKNSLLLEDIKQYGRKIYEKI